MAKGIDQEITSLNQAWNGYKGSRVEEFLKKQLTALHQVGEAKVGFITFEDGMVKAYDEPGGNVISSFSLSGTVYSITLLSSVPSSFFVLRDATTQYIDVTPSTKSGSIGGTMSDFDEDYSWTLYVDSGSGVYTERTHGNCIGGNAINVNVRDYLSVGTNRIRFSFTGNLSNQTQSITFTAAVTTLSLTCNYTWHAPWLEGQSYGINNIYFSGNLQKTLYVKLDGDVNKQYSQTFASGSNYVTAPYRFDLTSHFPGTTGVHTVEVWMTGNGVETPHYTYNMMCIAEGDEATAQLVVMNNVKNPAVNYNTQKLFEYATYGATTVEVNINATDGTKVFTVADHVQQQCQTQTKLEYVTKLEMDSLVTENFIMDITLTAGESVQTATVDIDNTNSYMPVAGEQFYLNAATRSNATADREDILNAADNATVASYDATWANMSWERDGWYQDGDGNKCLCINAGSSVVVPELTPLAPTDTESLSLEFKFRCSNISDYDTPIISMMSTDTYQPASTNGVIIFPTKIQVLSSSNREGTPQSVNLVENTMLHVVIVFQRLYKQTGRNLCHIYVNGIRQAVFEYAGTASFGNGSLKIGQQSADTYLYMMRIYEGLVLEESNVLANFLNGIIDGEEYTRSGVREDNTILDGGEVDYELTRRAGFNTMVIEMQNDDDIPSLTNSAGGMSTLRLEYADYPSWNVTIENAPIDGQGTTSMRYYRWNLRWKLGSSSVFSYDADVTMTDTKKGYIAGIGLHPKCQRITAKKNVASSMQGHKMGATNMYDDLYNAVGLKAGLPSGARVAVYQYPFMGFQKFQDGSYKFIGLYTVGPDKGDKGTFGYDTDTYPNLLSLEGPNHSPLGTRFLHPWTDETQYNHNAETLEFGGEEGWDVDVCAYETDGADDEATIQALLEAEWKPAYDIVYYNSPFIRSLAEVEMTLSQINAGVAAFRARMDILGNKKNDVLQMYDTSDYKIIYYRNSTGQYEKLQSFTVKEYSNGEYVSRTCTSILDYLGAYLDTQSPTTAQIIAARKAKFAAEAQYYWSINGLVFHEAFLELIGGSDNHAKNSYPFKFATLANGGRWSWRQDDLDTVMATDNNGQSTKSYCIEVNDLTSENVDIFQGASSNLWALVCDDAVFQPQVSSMMSAIFEQLVSLSTARNVGGSNVHERVFNMFAYYFWNKSAKYFPVIAYAKDSAFSYIDVWESAPTQTYNNVPPLRQALGTQIEAEKQWVERRIANICSKYGIGGFNGSADDGYGRLEFTPAANFNFQITPAIEMYPTGNRGGGVNVKGARTQPGIACQVTASSDGTTTFYIKGVDWYTDLGDLSGLALTTRGGDATVGSTFSVAGKRLRRLKVGDANAANVSFNASTLAVMGECIEEVDARNVVSISNIVDLQGCPRLRRALFAGSSAPLVLLPIGSKVSEVSMPSQMTTLFLHSLPKLTDANLSIPDAALATITGYYFNNCPDIDPFAILRRIMNAAGNSLAYVTIICDEPLSGTSTDVDLLAELCSGYGRVVYDSENNVISNSAAVPNLQLTINIAGSVYQDSVEAILAVFPDVTINATGYYIRFEDAEVMRICAENWGDYDEVVVTEVVSADSDVVEVTTVTTPVSMLNNTATRGTSVTVESTREKIYEEGVPETAGTTTTTTKVAKGITTTQAAAVSSIGTKFKNQNIRFLNLKPFTKITSLGSYSFQNMSSIITVESNTVGSLGTLTFGSCIGIVHMFFPALKTLGPSCVQNNRALKYLKLGQLVKNTSLTDGNSFGNAPLVYVALYFTEIPSWAADTSISKLFPNNPYIYVPDELLGDLKVTTAFSPRAAKMKPLSELEADAIANGWDY